MPIYIEAPTMTLEEALNWFRNWGPVTPPTKEETEFYQVFETGIKKAVADPDDHPEPGQDWKYFAPNIWWDWGFGHGTVFFVGHGTVRYQNLSFQEPQEFRAFVAQVYALFEQG